MNIPNDDSVFMPEILVNIFLRPQVTLKILAITLNVNGLNLLVSQINERTRFGYMLFIRDSPNT